MSDIIFVDKETFISTIAKDIFTADLHCTYQHGCRNSTDCAKCALLYQDCKRTFIAEQLYELGYRKIKE